MFLNYISILFLIFIGHLKFIFGLKSSNAKLYYSCLYLFSKQTFRLPKSARKDFLIIIRTYYFVIKHIFLVKPEIHLLAEGNVAAFDSGFNAEEKRMQYLKHFNVTPTYFLSRQNLIGSTGILQACVHFFFVTLFFISLLPFSFAKNKVNYAMLLREIVEWTNLINIFKKNKIDKLYHFCIYEKDANFLTYLLNKKNIWVSKITSEVPLDFANKIIITNELCLCFAYQVEEVEAFKTTMFYDRLQVWLPEMQISYLENYNNRKFEIPLNTIGFYSSALWLRKKMNHSPADIGSYDVEETLLKNIAQYLVKNKNLKLIIFTHPLEKRTLENSTLTKQYYKDIFGTEMEKNVELSDDKIKSTEMFHKVNIGIAVFSTIVFERLSLGFKTILAPFGKKDFPLIASPFRNICVYSKEELFEVINKNLNLTKDLFFENNGISSYRSSTIQLNYNLN